jgi:GNAT superfamily N-acetyltransferase
MRTGTIRKLLTIEKSLFRDHLLRLDAAGRRDRFMGGVADELLVHYATESFASKSLVLGYFEEDKLRAAGELHAPDDDLSDIAFSVEPEFRNRGIGTAMPRRLILSARNRKIQHLRMNCHGQNQAMQVLARKFKADLRVDYAETVGDIMPRAAAPFSFLMEALDDAREFGQAAIDVRRRLRLQSGPKGAARCVEAVVSSFLEARYSLAAAQITSSRDLDYLENVSESDHRIGSRPAGQVSVQRLSSHFWTCSR